MVKLSIDAKELKDLFTSVGWATMLSEDELYKAITNSSHLATYYKDGKLVAIARSMDDGIYSANIDLVVVHRDYQGCGIAKQVVKSLLNELQHIKYINVSPNESKNISLYLECGFSIIEDGCVLQLENH